MSDAVQDLLSFIDRSPTPYHAVAEVVRRLEALGFSRFAETAIWTLSPGTRGYAVRGDGSLIAFEVGRASPAQAGFRILGAHTDSPNLRLKPRPDRTASGYRQLGVEPYGGVLLHTWLDRDLSLAGRATVRENGQIRTRLIDFARPMVRIPNLAIHLFREIREEGLKLNPQTHLVPLSGLEDAPEIRDLMISEWRASGEEAINPEDILGFDLMTADSQPSALVGAEQEFISAPRLDNLASAHAAVKAMESALAQGAADFTRVMVLYDHEEVGSRTAQGAAGPFLAESLERIASAAQEGPESQGFARALAASTLISVDMAHAVHPNYSDRHEPDHRPVLGGGPVLKVNSNQAYATDGYTRGLFEALCAEEGFSPQHFVTRSDLACGSTIGPITAARIGIPTLDVGNPMLAMHSCREMAATADVAPMISVLSRFWRS
ncbi:MAG: M18 family aminopeptidase [bacterium TMED88]|nr:M18 family aminopeptidase [Deltaproteobacteria bacterium]OUV35909.1 MAG: M18 family aminopeptidase [bacterium TMED88]